MICQALRVENFLNDQCEFRMNFSVHFATFQSHETFWMAIFWCHLWTAIQLFSKVFAKTCPWFSWNLVKYLCSFECEIMESNWIFVRVLPPRKKPTILLLSPRLHVCTILIQHDKLLNSDFDIVHRKDKDDFGVNVLGWIQRMNWHINSWIHRHWFFCWEDLFVRVNQNDFLSWAGDKSNDCFRMFWVGDLFVAGATRTISLTRDSDEHWISTTIQTSPSES